MNGRCSSCKKFFHRNHRYRRRLKYPSQKIMRLSRVCALYTAYRIRVPIPLDRIVQLNGVIEREQVPISGQNTLLTEHRTLCHHARKVTNAVLHDVGYHVDQGISSTCSTENDGLIAIVSLEVPIRSTSH